MKADYAIVLAGNHNYINYLLLSVGTLLDANRDMKNMKLYIIESDMLEQDKIMMHNMAASFGRTCMICPLENICDLKEETGCFSRTSYSRLYVERVCEEDVVLYLDADILVTGSLKELLNWKFSESAVAAAVLDTVQPEFKVKIGLEAGNPYFNAGVILWNMKKIREQKTEISQQFVCFIKSYYEREHKPVPHNDQGVFNAVCANRIDTLPVKYNMMSGTLFYSEYEARKIYGMDKYYTDAELENAKRNPVIIHFTEGYYGRPWNRCSTHPYKDLFADKMNECGISYQIDETKFPIRKRITAYLHQKLPSAIFIIYCKVIQYYRKAKG